jgi:proline iminopeptidase
LEKLREHLGVVKWVVLGGCWGATLALSYALKHPNAVKALILGGIFTLRRYIFYFEACNGEGGGGRV